jgi:hypothetical protein
MIYLSMFAETLITTVRDILPIAFIIAFFQLFVLRRPLNNIVRLLWGFSFVVLGLAMFLMGLELALFPLGEEMANQLTASVGENQAKPWYSYYWTYLFAFAIGFSATIAEPALLAVAIKAHEASGGTIQIWILRAAVAVGCGTGVALGTFRIIVGIPLPYFVLAGYLIVIVQTYFAPRKIIPLAYDSGGVTTSTITVPLVTALGLGLAANIPGRNPLTEGFGMIALAVLFPMITVMGYAQLATWFQSAKARTRTGSSNES